MYFAKYVYSASSHLVEASNFICGTYVHTSPICAHQIYGIHEKREGLLVSDTCIAIT